MAMFTKPTILSLTDTAAAASFLVLMLELDDLIIITVYRSVGTNLRELAASISSLLFGTVLIVGDFNFQAEPRNIFTAELTRSSLMQRTKKEGPSPLLHLDLQCCSCQTLSPSSLLL
jgi:hypothetical protein